jgi:hypothetical protein
MGFSLVQRHTENEPLVSLCHFWSTVSFLNLFPCEQFKQFAMLGNACFADFHEQAVCPCTQGHTLNAATGFCEEVPARTISEPPHSA